MKNCIYFLTSIVFLIIGSMQGGQALIDAETAFEEFKPKIVELRKQYDEALAEEESSRYNNESFQNFISAVAFLSKNMIVTMFLRKLSIKLLISSHHCILKFKVTEKKVEE